ncbi:MAG: MFS transporter [Chloroflexota bacterium]|nr:MFS transporter [Chloroflexota bacterium]
MASAPAAQAGSQTIVLESHDEKERISPLSVGSWVLYDFANTIFSLNIISQFFPLFITRNLQLADVWYAYPMSASLLIVALISPLLGSLSDRKGGKRIPWLIACTLLCVSMTAIMGVVSDLYIIIIALIIANIGYQTGLIFYDALLPSVSTTLNWGKISGLGVGLGYVGSLAGAFAVLPFVSMYGTNQATFLPTALLFLVFAIPCFLFVRERPSATHRLTPAKEGLTWRNSFAQTWRTIGETRQVPGLSNFLLANFFYSDALSTVIVAMGVYAVNAIGFGTALEVLAPATVAAIIGSLLFGLITDRLTAKRSLVIALLIWVVVFLSAMFLTDKFLFQAFVAPLAGIALGGTWTAARTMMIELSPPARLGEFLGIYNLTGKISAVIGPLLWGTTLLILDPKVYGHFAYQVAIATLLMMVLIGLALHLRTPNIRRQRSPR